MVVKAPTPMGQCSQISITPFFHRLSPMFHNHRHPTRISVLTRDYSRHTLSPGLSRLGISPDMLSFTSVGLGIGFFLLAPFHFRLAFWLLVASVICDGLDGVEARLKRTNTPRGSFTDMFCDQLVVAFSVAGMAW